METMQDSQKILLVGTERNCRSIGYVLDFENYELIEKLTTENYAQYQDYQIYVCELKRKSKKLVDRKLLKSNNGIQYLDDICRRIDEVAQVKEPKKDYQYLKMCHGNSNVVQKYLQQLSPAELLLYVLHASVNPKIQCSEMEDNAVINRSGKIWGCCFGIVPFGKLSQKNTADEVFNSTYARIVKLSSLNKSYCLCNLSRWCKGYRTNNTVTQCKFWKTLKVPKKVSANFDLSCNLACKSCRDRFYIMDDKTRQRMVMITEKLLQSGWLEKSNCLVMAGMGEVFYSPYYRRLLETDSQRNEIIIKSNGILFNETNWRLIESKYKKINVEISVDAAMAETYRKLRGADFDVLMKNLNMLGNLHRQGKINLLGLYLVIQRDNYKEMPAFIKLARSIGADYVSLKGMSDWKSMPTKEYQSNCMVIKNKYLDYELWKVLQDPILKDEIVDLRIVPCYIKASEKKYRKRYEREQRAKQNKEKRA